MTRPAGQQSRGVRSSTRRCAVLVGVALVPALLAGCAPSEVPVAKPTPTPSSALARTPTPTPTPAPAQLNATPEMMTAGPLQTVLPELAAHATARDEVLVVPEGRWATTESVILPPGVRLRFAEDAVLTGDLPGRPLLRLAAGSSLSGGVLHNTSTSPGFDLDLAQGAQQVAISGVTFRGASSNSLYMAATGISDVRITGNRFEQVGYGILLNPPANDAQRITVQHNTFVSACADAVEINAATGGGAQRVRDVDVSDNHISGTCGSGPDSGLTIGLAGVDGFRVARNTIVDARNEAVHLEDGTTNGEVVSNRIQGGGHGDRPAIAIYRTTSNIRVTANSIDDFDGGGIGVRWDGLGSARAVTISGNRLRAVVGDGIVVSGGGGTGPFTVLGNSLSEIRGRGIVVVGAHEQTTVEGNVLRAIRGEGIAQELRGNGRTLISGNSED